MKLALVFTLLFFTHNLFGAGKSKACSKALEVAPPAFTAERFEWAKAKVQSEFVGIDSVIETLFQQIRSWYLFPKTRKEPMIIFLVGMTSTGKTQLVRQVINYLELNRDFNYFDMERFASKNESFAFGYDLSKSLTIKRKTQDLNLEVIEVSRNPVIMLDEFQKINTKNGLEYVERPMAQSVFEFLGNSGRLRVNNPTYWDLKQMLDRPDLYLPIPSDIKYGDKNKDAKQALEQKLLKQAQDLYESTPSQTILDLSSSLVFISANMDNVFTDSKVTNPEHLTADELHKNTMEIRPSGIRAGLMNMFRPEHVGRIGTRYIIFPSLSEASYRQYIHARLEDIKATTKKHYRLDLDFSIPFIERIYNEGVVPTQGVRPLIQTINSFALDPVSQIFSSLGVKSEEDIRSPIKVFADIDPKNPAQSLWTIHSGEKKGISKNFIIATEYHNSLQLKPEPNRTHSAIRIAAAVTVNAKAQHKLPAFARANSRSVNHDGVIRYNQQVPKTAPTFRSHLFADLVTTLAPLVAEKMIYGELSDASGADLINATRTAHNMAKDYGMAHTDLNLTNLFADDIRKDNSGKVRNNAEELIHEAVKIATDILSKEKDFFAALGQALTKKVQMDRPEIEALVRQTWSNENEKQEILRCAIPVLDQYSRGQNFLQNPGQFQFQCELDGAESIQSLTKGRIGF